MGRRLEFKRFPAPRSLGRTIVNSFNRKYIPGTSSLYGRNGHSATDIGSDPPGTPGQELIAVDYGIAHFEDHGSALGIQIALEACDPDQPSRPDNEGALYCHMQARAVQDGQRVKPGDLLGYMGHSGIKGRSGVPPKQNTHVHLEVLARWGDWYSPVDRFDELKAVQMRERQGIIWSGTEPETEEEEMRTAIEGIWEDRRDLYYVGATDNGLWHTYSTNGGKGWSAHERVGGKEGRKIKGFLSDRVSGPSGDRQDFRTIGMEDDIWGVRWDGDSFEWDSLKGKVLSG